jgi:uncharacterized protein (DUF2126 family)
LLYIQQIVRIKNMALDQDTVHNDNMNRLLGALCGGAALTISAVSLAYSSTADEIIANAAKVSLPVIVTGLLAFVTIGSCIDNRERAID